MTRLALFALGLGSAGCLGGIGPGVQDGPVGHGDAWIDNQSDTQVHVLASLQGSAADTAELDVAAGASEQLTAIPGNFGVAGRPCEVITALTIERVSDWALVLDQAICSDSDWNGEMLGEYEWDYTFTVTQAMADAAIPP